MNLCAYSLRVFLIPGVFFTWLEVVKGFLSSSSTVFCGFLCSWTHQSVLFFSEYPKLLFLASLSPCDGFVLILQPLYGLFVVHQELLSLHIVSPQKWLRNANAMLGTNSRPLTCLEMAHVCPLNSFWVNCPTACENIGSLKSSFNCVFYVVKKKRGGPFTAV